ncbi:hypothetical protein CAEBREN_16598 [Caenorhabditis brenneri]|uniref:Protein kinase domain-containing protein n=1 Tax=Caenorhabditis brenneri TaxID=135651 RepID=G0PIQ5_CAEBE|nr:hypothetical protein CAEBREN_16598 [Caenorhabditis brenneri]
MSKDDGPAPVSITAASSSAASGSAEKADELVFNLGTVISGFKLVKKIDEGGFGQVFKVTKDDKTFYAMKLESNSQEGGSAIKLEINVLSQLPKNSVFPGMIVGGRRTRYHYLVLELLGDNLKMLKSRSPNPDVFSDGTWSRLGIQCMFALKTMHDRGFVHRDVKPSNFGIGLNTPTENRTRNDAKKLIPPKPSSGKREQITRNIFRLARPHTDFRGTQQYASPNAHSLLELGRHDDIWSLMYMIAEFFIELPWTNNDDLPVDVLKAQSPLLRLFTDEKNLSHFSSEQYQRIRDIDKMLNESNYYTHPNYELVYDFLKEVMIKSKTNWDSPYDWETNSQKASMELSKAVKTKPGAWMEPGNFFKEDKWAHLTKPVLKSQIKPKSKTKSGSKANKRRYDNRECSKEDSCSNDSKMVDIKIETGNSKKESMMKEPEVVKNESEKKEKEN